MDAPMMDAEEDEVITKVMQFVKISSRSCKVSCPDELYKRAREGYKLIYKSDWDTTLHKDILFDQFYEVPDNLLLEFENVSIPEDVVIHELFVPWARTGLCFPIVPEEWRVQAQAIYDFLYRRLRRTVSESKNTSSVSMRSLVSMWDEAVICVGMESRNI
jgi:hypothetical protein